MKLARLLLLWFLPVIPGIASAAEDSVDREIPALAQEVMKAAGINNWPRVSQVKFTFNVDVNGKRKMSAIHDWNVREGKDTVTWQGKTATANLWEPGSNSGDEKGAYKRWVNDSYWLLAPMKLADKGVTVKELGEETVQGNPTQLLPALELKFKKVGLTPGDRYLLYIDPETKRVRFWDYIPNTKTKKQATWERYVEKGGLTLSTLHRMGDAEISISDLEIVTD